MANVLVKNMRIGGGLMLTVGDTQISIPGGVNGPAGFAPGTAMVDASFIEALEDNPVVIAMIQSGDLAIEGGEISTLILPPEVEQEIKQEEAEAHAAMQADIDASPAAPADEVPAGAVLAGVVEQTGEVKHLAEMTKAELLELATAEEIEGRHNMTKAELIAALEAPKE